MALVSSIKNSLGHVIVSEAVFLLTILLKFVLHLQVTADALTDARIALRA